MENMNLLCAGHSVYISAKFAHKGTRIEYSIIQLFDPAITNLVF